MLSSPCCQHERLYAETQQREERFEQLLLKEDGVDWKTGEKLFQPKVGRAPAVRNPFGLPIGDLLFEKRHRTKDIRDVLTEKLNEEENAKHVIKCARCLSSFLMLHAACCEVIYRLRFSCCCGCCCCLQAHDYSV